MARFKSLSDFYKSPEWITLRKRLMIERSTPEKGLLCQKCHETILNDPECIAHHIIELTPMNVNEIKISLNPNNILLVHHQCHNQIHERFGQGSRQKVYLVYGAPLSGKTSYVKAHKKRSDLVLDMDELYQAITLLPAYDKPLELSTNVFLLRDALLDQIRTRTAFWPYCVYRERKTIFHHQCPNICYQRSLRSRGFGWFNRKQNRGKTGSKGPSHQLYGSEKQSYCRFQMEKTLE